MKLNADYHGFEITDNADNVNGQMIYLFNRKYGERKIEVSKYEGAKQHGARLKMFMYVIVYYSFKIFLILICY